MIKQLKYLFAATLAIMFASCHQGEKNKEKYDVGINVMSFNVRYDNPDDGVNNWQYRKENVAKAIRFYNVDIFGAQELLLNQKKDLEALLSNYKCIGVGRDDGKTAGEYVPLFYNTQTLRCIDSGYFWLSETPDVPGSIGWDAGCKRVCTWGKFEFIRNGKSFFMINTHLDNAGELARKEGTKLLLEKINALHGNLPIIVTGDFNSTENSPAYIAMTSRYKNIKLSDSKKQTHVIYGPSWSFHDFGKLPLNERPLIDFIFVGNDIQVLRYGVLAEKQDQMYLSDHNPILTTIKLK